MLLACDLPVQAFQRHPNVLPVTYHSGYNSAVAITLGRDSAAACAPVFVSQVDLAKKPQEFVELYHSIIPDADVKERVPVLVHGPKRLADHTTIVVSHTQQNTYERYCQAKVKRTAAPLASACRPLLHGSTCVSRG